VETHVPHRQGQQVNQSPLVYPLLYNGPISYYARLVRENEIVLEQFDSYVKQTYRNRCIIIGPNGLLTLSIPVKRRRGTKNHFRDIRIDHEKPWNRVHWKSLVAAYGSSPFFEFIREELVQFYEKKFEFLIDLNRQLLDKTLNIMGLDIPLRLTAEFQEMTGEDDPRWFIHPKLEPGVADPMFNPVAYHQVFSDRHGFRANMSILDLLFNEGPGSLALLRKCIRT
jgi:hypothetical protein